jgi:hypothetical protein
MPMDLTPIPASLAKQLTADARTNTKANNIVLFMRFTPFMDIYNEKSYHAGVVK